MEELVLLKVEDIKERWGNVIKYFMKLERTGEIYVLPGEGSEGNIKIYGNR